MMMTLVVSSLTPESYTEKPASATWRAFPLWRTRLWRPRMKKYEKF
jgi:hypothetical protein